jgi:hypothetical protein
MRDRRQDLLDRIASARPANEAEVETKILLYVFELLGYRDVDRADKCAVHMQFGRERMTKVADFLFYDGPERGLANALITVEAKKVGESLDEAANQAKSYAQWAGTPFYVVCNGDEFLASQYLPGAEEVRVLRLPVSDLRAQWSALSAMLQRSEVIRAKERLHYLARYLPRIEELPASEFFQEYLTRLQTRFSAFRTATVPFQPPVCADTRILHLPVTLRLTGDDDRDIPDRDLPALLRQERRLLVFGEPGSGKSNLCARVTSVVTETALVPGARIVPIHVRIAEGMPGSIGQALEMACNQLGIPFFSSLFHDALERSEVVVLLDGLDEAGEPRVASAQLEAFLRSVRQGSVLLTSRPVGAGACDTVLTGHRFRSARIRDLTDAEVGSVFQAYLGDESDTAGLRERLSPAGVAMLRSPMLALMAVQVAASIPAQQSLTTFDLFARYVVVLHDYFNAPTVRGTDRTVDRIELFAGLAFCAQVVRAGRTESQTLRLEDLTLRAAAEGREPAVAALLNAGILTSVGGRAAFLHPAFEDFGYAWQVLSALRAGDAEGFARRHCAPHDLVIAHTAVQATDESQLRAWLAHPDARVRRLSARLLSLGCDAASLDAIIDRLPHERKTGTLALLTRALLGHGDLRLRDWLDTSAETLTKHKLTRVALQLREVCDPGYAEHTLRLALRLPRGRELAKTAVLLCLAHDRSDLLEDLVRLYEASSNARRTLLITDLGLYVQRPTGWALVLRLLNCEDSVANLVRLLKLCRGRLPELPAALVQRAHDLISRDRGEPGVGRTGYRSLARILQAIPSRNEALDELLQLSRARAEKGTAEG